MGVYPIDPTFISFYEYFEGSKHLGNVISASFEVDGLIYQYVEAGLMVYDKLSPENNHFQFAPIGVNSGWMIPAIDNQDGTLSASSEHPIFPAFLPLHQKLGGEYFAGPPLTGVRYNPIRKRFEQYFQNLGFYILEGETNLDKVKLLAYGSYACGSRCSYDPSPDSEVVISAKVDDRFKDLYNRLTPGFTGFPLTTAYQLADGSYEQIFENLVMRTKSIEDPTASIAPITNNLNMIPGSPVENRNNPDTVFFPISDILGYHVPVIFDQIVNYFGGYGSSGPPISEANFKEDGNIEQCFENICLTYDPYLPYENKVRLEPIGYIYKELASKIVQVEKPDKLERAGIQIVTEEKYPWIAAEQTQELTVRVYHDGQPVPDLGLLGSVLWAEGVVESIEFLPTDSAGETSYTLTTQALPAGSLIPYRVCLESSDQPEVCADDTFLIWEAP